MNSMFSIKSLTQVFGVSRATIYRIIRKAGLENKHLYTLEEIKKMLPYIKTIDDIRMIDGKVKVRLSSGAEIDLEGEAFQEYIQTVSKSLSSMRQFETTVLTTITNLTTQMTSLVETVKELAIKILRIEEMLLSRQISKEPEDIAKRRKAISLAIDDYIRHNNLLYSNKDDIFIELLQSFERDKQILVRKQYQKADKTYINTLIRLGVDEDFIKHVRDKCI